MFWKIRDPVCKVKVNKNTEYQIIYGRKVYYFDCEACMKTFKENPERYIEKESFLEKTAKAGKELPKCH